MKFEKVKEEIFLNTTSSKRLLHLKVFRSNKRLCIIFIFRQYVLQEKIAQCINLTSKLLSGYFNGEITWSIEVDKEKKRKILTIITPSTIKESLLTKTINFLSVNLYKEFL